MDGLPLTLPALLLVQSQDVAVLGTSDLHVLVTGLLPIALMAAAIIVILYYLLGKFLNSPQIDAFAKEELSQFWISVLIAVCWVALYGIISGMLSIAACGDTSCSLFSLAFYSLDVLFYQVASAYASFYMLEVFIGVLSSIGFSLPLGAPVMGVKWLSFHPFGGMSMLSNSVVSIIESIGVLVGLVVGRRQLLSFFYDIIPGILFPLGLFLRSLPFTRITGSSIIAISFAAFFIFPASIVLSHDMMFGAAEPVYIPPAPTPTGLYSLPEDPEDVEGALAQLNETNLALGEEISDNPYAQVANANAWYKFSGFVGTASKAFPELLGGLMDYVGAHVSWYSFIEIFKPTTFAYFFYFLTLERLQGVAQLAVMVTVTFVIEIIITITGYRAIAAALGGEMEILGLTKVV